MFFSVPRVFLDFCGGGGGGVGFGTEGAFS